MANARLTLKHPLVITTLTLFLLIAAGLTVAHFKAESWVGDFLDRKLPPHVQLSYEQLNVDILSGSIELKEIDLRLKNRDSLTEHSNIQLKSLNLIDLNYWHFFMNERIQVEVLELDQPSVRHYLDKVVSSKNKERRGVVSLLKTIKVERLTVKNGELTLHNKDSLTFNTKDINFEVYDAKTGPSQIREKIPVTYGEYNLALRDLYLNLGAFEELNVANLSLENGRLQINNLNLNTKFSKSELSKKISVERDHIDLKIPETIVDSIKVGFTGDTLFVSTGNGRILNPKAEIYRDKLVDDDLKKKRLYSRMLRELPIDIEIPKIKIDNGNLVYSELITPGVAPGRVSFDELNAIIDNVDNLSDSNDKTEINASALLMNHAPIELKWSFDVSQQNDAFTASGVIKDFKSKSINSYLESSLRAKAKGNINRMYFTISGDAISSSGDIKMNYEDFEFSVLKKNRLGVNKLLTFIGKLFINDGSNSDEDGFRYGTIEVQRDPTKSFFNYLWLNVQDGTVNTLIGKSEKE
ncbi:hypothetical protein B0O79_0933 [Flavobacteriaceae bacterium MAR_2009_75]|nr:hypothetical protein B0O79_0933 [Flavobacteriaceae bacterium MAR_2009_75]